MSTKEAFKKTAYTEKTSESYIIDTAVVYTNVELKEGEFVGNLIGATAGGVTLEIAPEYEKIEIDGTSHVDVKGAKKLVSAKASLTVRLKELTLEVLRQSLNAEVKEAPGDIAPAGYKMVDMTRRINESSYIDNIACVGRMSGSDKPIIIILDNVLANSPLTLETQDNNEAVVEIVYEAHASIAQLENEEWPWRILYPEVA